MDSDREQPTEQETQRELEDEAGGMQRRIDELGDHVEEAAKKARGTRGQTTLDDDDPLDAEAEDASERTTSSDDPTSAVGDPSEADDR